MRLPERHDGFLEMLFSLASLPRTLATSAPAKSQIPNCLPTVHCRPAAARDMDVDDWLDRQFTIVNNLAPCFAASCCDDNQLQPRQWLGDETLRWQCCLLPSPLTNSAFPTPATTRTLPSSSVRARPT